MSTKVFVNVNGMVQHTHPEAKGWGKNNWHDPAKKHENAELHKRENAEKPEGFDQLSVEQKRQYAEALAGKSFMDTNLKLSAQRRNLPEGTLHEARPRKATEEEPEPETAQAGNGRRTG